jgi:hypothetical protein
VNKFTELAQGYSAADVLSMTTFFDGYLGLGGHYRSLGEYGRVGQSGGW